jgi:DNA-binding PadR family transcriptional regulator
MKTTSHQFPSLPRVPQSWPADGHLLRRLWFATTRHGNGHDHDHGHGHGHDHGHDHDHLHGGGHGHGGRGGEGHGHYGGGRFARHGRGFGGDDDFSRGRKFSSDDLQLLLLDLLVDEPRHGYELIKLLQTRSNGFYTPSPGMVYPALTYLEEIGYTVVTAEGNRKRYALNTEGRNYVESNRERIDVIWAKLNFFAERMGLVRRALADEDAGADDERAGRHPLRALMEARAKLKEQLMSQRHASPEEQLRIAGVLERAAAEIAGDRVEKPNER